MTTHVLMLPFRFLPFLIAFLFFFANLNCRKIREYNQEPNIESLRQGFKTSAAIGYCASLAYSYFHGAELPENVIIQTENSTPETESGIMIVSLNDMFPLPFNSNTGQIIIAGVWGSSGGVITTIFTDINILEAKYEFKGIHTIPVIETDDGNIMTLFAAQDIIVGEGSDTLINLNLTNPQIVTETDRLNQSSPGDAFAAVKQNVWFVSIDQNNTSNYVYDDACKVYGGGQIAEVSDSDGGIIYHAMIGAEFCYDACHLNPTSGVGFIQNIKAGEGIDLGHISLSFHSNCNGEAFVEFSSGKYIGSNRQDISLNFY